MFFPKLLDAPGRLAPQHKRADGNQQKQRHAYDQARLLHRIGSSSVCAFFEHSIRPPRERYRGPDFRVPNPNKRPAPYSFQFPAASCESNRRVIAFGAARGTNLSGCAEMRGRGSGAFGVPASPVVMVLTGVMVLMIVMLLMAAVPGQRGRRHQAGPKRNSKYHGGNRLDRSHFTLLFVVNALQMSGHGGLSVGATWRSSSVRRADRTLTPPPASVSASPLSICCRSWARSP